MPMLNSKFDPLVIDQQSTYVKDDAQRQVLSLTEALDVFDSSNQSLWVRIEPADDVRTLSPYADRLLGVEVNFPAFRDGRGYSTSRILRDDMGFKGPIRAIGDVLRDQLFVMLRCGFSEFALKDRDPKAAIDAAKKRFSTTYQSVSDARAPTWAIRQKLRP